MGNIEKKVFFYIRLKSKEIYRPSRRQNHEPTVEIVQ